MSKKGLLIIIAGPSGVGKGTIRKLLMKDKSLNLKFSISLTTRKPRVGEKDGVDYFFVSEKKFLNAIKKDDFLEYTNFVGNYYGTSKSYVNTLRNKGKNVILEIEVKGSKNIISKFSKDEVLSFFIVPPSLKELEKRLKGRKTESKEAINNRLKTAKEELKLKKMFDYVVVNDSPIRACKEIRRIISKKNKRIR